MTRAPMFVHCCHCTYCQRETGASFALNALIESSEIELVSGEPEIVATPTNSGKAQDIARCPTCKVAVWSNYGGRGDVLRFVRVGTLEHAASIRPDIHIFTTTKQPWLSLGDDVPVMDEYYRASEHWPQESLERRQALRSR